MNAAELLKIINDSGVFSNTFIIDVLEDGVALSALGLTDDDQETIEELHAITKQALKETK